MYSFKGGSEEIARRFPGLLAEVYAVIGAVDAQAHKVKVSGERTMPGRILFSPPSLNAAFAREFKSRGWTKVKVGCTYSSEYYVEGYQYRFASRGQFREMDFVKDSLGIEVQFGKYAFMVYNVCAKMTIFHNLGYITCGVEIVPIKALVDEMSTGVSYFEQFVWDLQHRGVADIDIPVLVLGVDV